MFSKKPTIDVKKSIQKFLDVKRDSPTRFKHLKITLDHIDIQESKTLVETHFSQVFYIFYDTYTAVEAALKQKGHRQQREEIEGVLPLLERILTLVPELLHQRWHSHTLFQLFLRLLHPGNHVEIRRTGIRLFLLWYQVLGDNADEAAHSIFRSIVPGFPNQYNHHWEETSPLSATPPGEKVPEDLSRYYLDYLMEWMVKQVNRIEWRDKNYGRPQKCFGFLLKSFQRFYLPYIFPNLSKDTNLYRPSLDTSELKRLSLSEYSTSSKQPLLSCRVIVLKWLTNLTHISQRSKEHQNAVLTPSQQLGSPGMDTSFHSQASDRDSVSLVEQDRRDVSVAQEVLFGTKENINLVIELYRQGFLLPMQHSAATRRVLSLYKDWIQGKVEMPVFMLEPRETEDYEYKGHGISKEGSIRAGLQNTLQIFITHAAHVFLSWIPPHAAVLLEEQVDVCKRVLNIYRSMVMNTRMEQKTWEQLLLVLLQVTSQVLNEPTQKKEDTLGNRLAPALFQTLIVTWIRANLNVAVSSELWDQFVHVLSSLASWEALVREWAKTMDTLTRVLAKNVYQLDLSDLPLDRLSEQKAKKRRAGQIDPPNKLNLPQPRTSSAVSRSQTTTPASTPTNPPPHSSSAAAAHRPAASQNHDEPKSASGSVRSRSSVAGGNIVPSRSRRRHSSSGDTHLNEAAFPHLPLVRSRSEGRLPRILSPALPRSLRGLASEAIPSIPANVENRITRMLALENASTAQVLRRPVPPRRQQLRKKSRSADSIAHLRPSAALYSDSEGESRSPSPAPSSGLESNSIKDSPIQIDMMANDHGSLADGNTDDGSRSVMMGGKVKGWLPDVAAVMWKRMLGSLGDPNEGKQPAIHAAIFQYLVELGSVLIKIRQNQGVSLDNLNTPPMPRFVPPLFLLLPWCHKALLLPAAYSKGKLHAMQLLCNITVRRQDVPLNRNHVLQFYRALHRSLLSDDQEMINIVVKHCGARFFSLQLPGYSLLALDFLHGANTVISSSDLKGSPRVEATSLIGSLICLPEVVPQLPVLQPKPQEFSLVTFKETRDQVVALALKAAKREPTSVGRCVALSSLAIFVYSHLSAEKEHPKIREAVSVLLAVLKHCVPAQPAKPSSASEFKNKAVAQVACDMLLLLSDKSEALLRLYPDLAAVVIEELSHTFLALAFAVTCNDQTKRLLLSLALSLGEWCMSLPMSYLLESGSQQDPSQLLQTVFKVLHAVATGNRSPVSQLFATEEEVDRAVDNIGENLTTITATNTPTGSPVRDTDGQGSGYGRVRITAGENQENMKAVRLAAKMVLNHLVNHIGHFPMGIGAARLSSAVMEHDDLPGYNSEELLPEIFQSPSVQFFVLNSRTLMSLVELPALESAGRGTASPFQSAKSQVRIILRDLGGKSCWDASILYALREDATLTRISTGYPISAEPSFVQENLLTSSFVGTTAGLQPSPPRLSVRHRPTSSLPTWEDTADDMDNLDDLLLYIGATSPECIPFSRTGESLASPAPPPNAISADIEDEVVNVLLQQKHTELDFVHKHGNDPWMRAIAAEEPLPEDPQSAFQLSRMIFSQLGLTSWDKRRQVYLLKKSDKLLRELKNLDSQKCRETHKIAIIYVGEGQEDKNSILSNSGGSQGFEDFVAAMAWEVELESHTGFMGGLQRNRSTGETAPYFATSFTEVIFHVSTRMPSHNQDALLQKMRHLGNDEVHIVWSEHSRDYRRGIFPTEFCDVLIVIYPLPNRLYRIQISRKPDVPFVGPLFNECIVDESVLPGLVRATALNASRATRSMLPYYLTFYEERSKALESITQSLKESTTFEDFCIQLCSPGPALNFSSSSSGPSSSCYTSSLVDIPVTSSGPPLTAGHVTFSSENSFGFPVNIFRHNSDKQKGMDLTASGDSEESSYTSPKANKRLSFKHAARKASAFGGTDY